MTGVDDEPSGTLPGQFALGQNYPNPFNPSTEIAFTLPERAEVEVAVVNILGQTVSVVADGEYAAGEHIVTWDGRTSNGEEAASGVYFYRMSAGSFSQSRKMLLLR